MQKHLNVWGLRAKSLLDHDENEMSEMKV